MLSGFFSFHKLPNFCVCSTWCKCIWNVFDLVKANKWNVYTMRLIKLAASIKSLIFYCSFGIRPISCNSHENKNIANLWDLSFAMMPINRFFLFIVSLPRPLYPLPHSFSISNTEPIHLSIGTISYIFTSISNKRRCQHQSRLPCIINFKESLCFMPIQCTCSNAYKSVLDCLSFLLLSFFHFVHFCWWHCVYGMQPTVSAILMCNWHFCEFLLLQVVNRWECIVFAFAKIVVVKQITTNINNTNNCKFVEFLTHFSFQLQYHANTTMNWIPHKIIIRQGIFLSIRFDF